MELQVAPPGILLGGSFSRLNGSHLEMFPNCSSCWVYSYHNNYRKCVHCSGWHCFGLEYCDSKLVVDAFSSKYVVPWQFRNQWKNCLVLCQQIQFWVSHIYRGNSCAYKLASIAIVSPSFSWWDVVLDFIGEDFNRNRLGLPSYRLRGL